MGLRSLISRAALKAEDFYSSVAGCATVASVVYLGSSIMTGLIHDVL